MNCYIPLATGQKIPQQVIDSIVLQTIEPEIVICESAGEINSEHVFTPLRISSEINNRNKAISRFLTKTQDEFFFMCCSDVLQLNATNFSDQINHLKNLSDLGACALPFEWCSWQHVDIASICIKREVLEKGFLFANRYGLCPCKEAVEDFNKLGYKFEYLNKDFNALIKNVVPRI
jgi:hypothetical protein